MSHPMRGTMSGLMSGLLLLAAACGRGGGPPAFSTLSASALPDSGEIFPTERWIRLEDPGARGWDAGALADLEAHAPEVGSSAGMVVHDGVVVAAWGDVAKRENSQSMRKSLTSGLVGTLVADDSLRLDATLAGLGVRDDPPLSEEERRATVRDLLHARSGVYHSSVYEFPDWKERKPERGAHPPGTHFFYNNWDFNVLESLAERAAGRPYAEAFRRRIAEPLGMEDFRPRDVHVITDRALSERYMGNDSDFPAHLFMISARDLARFGLLYLRDGRWEDRRVLPGWWVEESTAGLPTQRDIAYGYLWWVDPDGTWFPGPDLGVPLYFARGSRGHYVLVIPSLELVVVNRVETGGTGLFSQLRRRLFGSGRVRESDFADMLKRVIEAHPSRRTTQATTLSTTDTMTIPTSAIARPTFRELIVSSSVDPCARRISPGSLTPPGAAGDPLRACPRPGARSAGR